MRMGSGAGAWWWRGARGVAGVALGLLAFGGAAGAAEDPVASETGDVGVGANDHIIQRAPIGQRGQSAFGMSAATDREGAATANYGSLTIERKTLEDAAVVAKLHHINEMEIDAGAMAQDKGTSRGVRDFGARLARDHQLADAQVVAYANKNGIDPNAMPAAGSNDEAKDHEMMEGLRTLSGAAFDHAFATMMADGHARAIKFVRSAARGAVHDSELRGMLSGLLPTLEKHEQIARSLVPHGRS